MMFRLLHYSIDICLKRKGKARHHTTTLLRIEQSAARKVEARNSRHRAKAKFIVISPSFMSTIMIPIQRHRLRQCDYDNDSSLTRFTASLASSSSSGVAIMAICFDFDSPAKIWHFDSFDWCSSGRRHAPLLIDTFVEKSHQTSRHGKRPLFLAKRIILHPSRAIECIQHAHDMTVERHGKEKRRKRVPHEHETRKSVLTHFGNTIGQRK